MAGTTYGGSTTAYFVIMYGTGYISSITPCSSDIRFKENIARQQQETLGVLGTNLIYGAFYKYHRPKKIEIAGTIKKDNILLDIQFRNMVTCKIYRLFKIRIMKLIYSMKMHLRINRIIH